MIPVYVAAGSSEAPRAAALIQKLRAAGVLVTYDWTPAVLREGSAQMGYVPATHAVRDPATALAEIDGVKAAEVVWFLVPRIGSSGAGFEIGLAYGLSKIVVCSGPDRERFYFGVVLPEYPTDEEVLSWLINLERER